MDALSDGGGSVSITRINGVTLAGGKMDKAGKSWRFLYFICYQ